jgi:hypothetical protein
MMRAKFLLLVVLQLACSKHGQGSGPHSPEAKGAFNSPCSSNADCQGMMCRSGRCH